MKRELSEADILGQILDYLRLHRIWHRRWNVGARVESDAEGRIKRFIRFGRKGDPDILCCVSGRFVGIEVKDATGRQSAEQKICEQELTAAGGVYVLARSLEDLLERLPSQQKHLELAKAFPTNPVSDRTTRGI